MNNYFFLDLVLTKFGFDLIRIQIYYRIKQPLINWERMLLIAAICFINKKNNNYFSPEKRKKKERRKKGYAFHSASEAAAVKVF